MRAGYPPGGGANRARSPGSRVRSRRDRPPADTQPAPRSLRVVKDTVGPPLRAAAVAAFLVGTVLFLLNPPSLSGAGGLATLVVGAVALILVTSWATVALTGRDGMSEQEFERLVERTEALSEGGRPVREPSEFELLVADAIDRLPREFQELLERTPVVVSSKGRETRAYGHYFGDTVARGNWEQRIVLYEDTLVRDYGHDPELLREQVDRTLRHELAHHLGWPERGVRELGL
jgi:predicted Zn-dependent protease with MMP-like domain